MRKPSRLALFAAGLLVTGVFMDLGQAGYITGLPFFRFCTDECSPTYSLLQIQSVVVSQTGASVQISNPTLASFRGTGASLVCVPDDSGGPNCQVPFGKGVMASVGMNFSIGPLQTMTLTFSFAPAIPHGNYTVQVNVGDGLYTVPAFWAKIVSI